MPGGGTPGGHDRHRASRRYPSRPRPRSARMPTACRVYSPTAFHLTSPPIRHLRPRPPSHMPSLLPASPIPSPARRPRGRGIRACVLPGVRGQCQRSYAAAISVADASHECPGCLEPPRCPRVAFFPKVARPVAFSPCLSCPLRFSSLLMHLVSPPLLSLFRSSHADYVDYYVHSMRATARG